MFCQKLICVCARRSLVNISDHFMVVRNTPADWILVFYVFWNANIKSNIPGLGGGRRAINSTIKPWGTAVDVEVVSASHRIGGTFTLFLPNFENWTKHGSRDFLVPQVSVAPRSHTWFGAEALHFVHADICVSSDLVGRSREQQPTTLEISVQNSKSSGVREHHFETGLHHKGSEHRWIHILSAGKQTNRPSFLLKYGWRLFFFVAFVHTAIYCRTTRWPQFPMLYLYISAHHLGILDVKCE